MSLLDPAHREIDLSPPKKNREIRQIHKNKDNMPIKVEVVRYDQEDEYMKPKLEESLLPKDDQVPAKAAAKERGPGRGLLSIDPVKDYETALSMREGKRTYEGNEKKNWKPLNWELESIMLSAVGMISLFSAFACRIFCSDSNWFAGLLSVPKFY